MTRALTRYLWLGDNREALVNQMESPLAADAQLWWRNFEPQGRLESIKHSWFCWRVVTRHCSSSCYPIRVTHQDSDLNEVVQRMKPTAAMFRGLGAIGGHSALWHGW